MVEVRTLARDLTSRGEVLLRVRRDERGEVTELVVNGVFAMDSAETASEQALAELVPAWASRVLVGGLGLGYTASAVLDRPGLAVDHLDVVELEECLVRWAHEGLTPVLAAVARDPRVRLHAGDVATTLTGAAGPAGPWDAVLLDVDNGPDFLVHDANAGLYEPPLLADAHARLTPGGVLAVWCQDVAPELASRLGTLGRAREHRYRVSRQGRSFDYVVYTVERAGDPFGQNDEHG